jgi:hypothetical protein
MSYNNFNFIPMKTFLNDTQNLKRKADVLDEHLSDTSIFLYSYKEDVLCNIRKIYCEYDSNDKVFDFCAEKGYLHVLKWLHKNYQKIGTKKAMELASKNGHLKVVEWLFENTFNFCAKCSAQLAEKAGHLHIIEWFQKNSISNFFEYKEHCCENNDVIKCKLNTRAIMRDKNIKIN